MVGHDRCNLTSPKYQQPSSEGCFFVSMMVRYHHYARSRYLVHQNDTEANQLMGSGHCFRCICDFRLELDGDTRVDLPGRGPVFISSVWLCRLPSPALVSFR